MTERKKVKPCREVLLLMDFRKQFNWTYDRISREMGIHSATVQSWCLFKYTPNNLGRQALRKFLSQFQID